MIRLRSKGDLAIVVTPNRVIIAHTLARFSYGPQPIYKQGTYIELTPSQARVLGMEEEAQLAEQLSEGLETLKTGKVGKEGL